MIGESIDLYLELNDSLTSVYSNDCDDGTVALEIEVRLTCNTATGSPTKSPSMVPTDSPTELPSNAPTNTLTEVPSNSPFQMPTNGPSTSPTNSPTITPTSSPSIIHQHYHLL